MQDLNYWLLFLSAAFLLNIAPGPDLLYILTKTLSGGRKIGWASAMGVCSGALIHAIIAALGLSAVLASSAVAFNAIKYIGVAYLLFLAWQSFRSNGMQFDITNKKINQDTSAWKAYRQGILVDVLNPKVALFFMSFLPQFVREGHGSASLQLIYLGLLVVAIAAIVETTYVLLAAKLMQGLRKNKKFSLWLDRIVGCVFIGLAIKLVLTEND